MRNDPIKWMEFTVQSRIAAPLLSSRLARCSGLFRMEEIKQAAQKMRGLFLGELSAPRWCS